MYITNPTSSTTPTYTIGAASRTNILLRTDSSSSHRDQIIANESLGGFLTFFNVSSRRNNYIKTVLKQRKGQIIHTHPELKTSTSGAMLGLEEMSLILLNLSSQRNNKKKTICAQCYQPKLKETH